jgi:hypothetical protein
VLKTRGFEGDSRQAGPVRPVYNADQPITALKGTGIRTAGPSVKKDGDFRDHLIDHQRLLLHRE